MAYESQHDGTRWLTQNWTDLNSEHRHHWVAADGTGIVSSSDSFETLISSLNKTSWEDLVFAFVDEQDFDQDERTSGPEQQR